MASNYTNCPGCGADLWVGEICEECDPEGCDRQRVRMDSDEYRAGDR